MKESSVANTRGNSNPIGRNNPRKKKSSLANGGHEDSSSKITKKPVNDHKENDNVTATKEEKPHKKAPRKRRVKAVADLSSPVGSVPESAKQFSVNNIEYTPTNKDELTRMNIEFLSSKEMESSNSPIFSISKKSSPVVLLKDIALINSSDDPLILKNTNINIKGTIKIDTILDDLTGIFSDDEETDYSNKIPVIDVMKEKKKKKSRDSAERLERSKRRAEKFKQLAKEQNGSREESPSVSVSSVNDSLGDLKINCPRSDDIESDTIGLEKTQNNEICKPKKPRSRKQKGKDKPKDLSINESLSESPDSKKEKSPIKSNSQSSSKSKKRYLQKISRSSPE